MDVYQNDLTEKAAEYAVRKYPSHRGVSDSFLTDSYVLQCPLMAAKFYALMGKH